MNIVVLGASGHIGSLIRAEALSRGHWVTAVTRSTPLAPVPGLVPVTADIADAAGLARILAGHDAVISAYSPGLARHDAEAAAGLIAAAHEALFDALVRSGVRRLILVGGVGSLEASPGVDVVDSDFYPAGHRAHTLRNREILRALKRGEHDLDWTYASPPLRIEAGPRTGAFRLGEDALLRDSAGESLISRADFAVALLDELERGRFLRRRFTVAY